MAGASRALRFRSTFYLTSRLIVTLVVDLAKHLFLLSEPGRKRVPKGFAESFQIGIRAIKPGSTVAVLDRLSSVSGMAELFPTMDRFDDARDLIEAVVAAAGSKAMLPPTFPAHLVKRFNQFGRGLRDDEYVELRRPGATSGPRYDRAIRKWIVIQQEGRYEDAVDVIGWVSGGVIDRESITIRLDGDALIDGKCPAAIVRQALVLAEQRVRVVGIGSFDRNDRLERFVRVDDVSAVDEDDTQPSAVSSLERQFDDLASLREGWFEPGTPALERVGLSVVRRFMAAVTEHGVPSPHVYPTPDAEARAEWSFSDWEVSATFDLRRLSLNLHATQRVGDSSQSSEFEIETEDAPEAFVSFLQRFLAKPKVL